MAKKIVTPPEQPYIDTEAKFNWEDESTLVDRRNRPLQRVLRVFRSIWFWLALGGLLTAALFDADLMRMLISIGGFAIQIGFAASYIIFQFFIMYWFVSRTRQYTIMPGAEGVGFSDYRGQPEILEQAQQMVMLLRGVKAFEKAGGEPLNGLLLEGPPGTGKTWLAQAISTEAGVPFYYVDTSSLQGMFMGVGNMKVARMYNKARKAAKEYGAAVIFLDEIDSVGSRGGVASVGGGTRGGGMGGMGGGMGMGILSTLLIEMSGFSLEHGWRAKVRGWWYKKIMRRDPPRPPKRVLTIGATNRIQALDPALLRPGRFDKKIRIDAPDALGRQEVFAYYLSKMAHDATMDPVILASETPGYTPADMKYLLNEALRHALFDGRRYISYSDFQAAKPEHELGLRAPLTHMSKEARERLAFYYASKAAAIRLFMPEHRISRIAIVRQGMNYGHVSHYPARESYQGMRTRDQYMNLLKVYAAGKAGELEFCGVKNQSMGMGGDFQQLRFWLNMMAQAGMLGSLGANAGMRADFFGGMVSEVSPEMTAAMEKTYQDVLVATRRALRENGDMIRALVALLMEKEELLADEIKAFFDKYGLATPDPSLIRDGEEIQMLLPPEPAAGD
ncbi:MAG: AAA family ATPase [Pleurocapsa minor GSE-CHR-MK-17-07R]|jgi:ATP-dependent Zn protease|nr:AAA family ATPase [Pleurocapsa minor GSE-CHR-MK 17-07R]